MLAPPATRTDRKHGLAIFGWKKSGGGDGAPGDPGKGGPGNGDAPGQGVTSDPAKAGAWFDRARTVHETTNYEYALQCWLQGLRLDPTNMSALEAFFTSVSLFLADNEPKSLSKDVAKSVGGRSDVDRYLTALLEWGLKPADPSLAVKAAEHAAGLNLVEPGFWIGERALGAVRLDKKPRKDWYIKLMESFGKIGAFEKATLAGEAAYRLDPTDGPLGAQVRNLAAQATMNKGGFDQAGKAGGFRANIRDFEKQRHLEEEQRVVKTAETIDRLLATAEEDYRKRPEDLPTINALAKRLKERGRPEDEERAHTILMEAFGLTKQFRFRMDAGDIRLRQERRKVSEIKKQLDATPGDEDLRKKFRDSVRAFVQLELEEFLLRSEAYPTDLTLKFEIGKRYFDLGRNEEAVGQLQDAQNELKNRAAAMNIMAQAFLRMDLADEAVATFRGAMEVRDVLPDLAMEIKYGLMMALQAKAEHSRDLPTAEEAERLASSILVQQIGYRDIRARREAIKKLIADLRAKTGA